MRWTARIERFLRPHQVGREAVPTILQHEAVECGAACLAMVLAYHGRWVSLEELRESCGVSRDGTKSTNILKAARGFGLLAKGLKKEPEQLAALPFPMILFWAFNHFVVLEGISGDKVWLNDPAMGPRTLTLEEFSADFTGVVLAFQPTDAFQPGGYRPSLASVIGNNLRGVRGGLVYALLAGAGLLVPGIIVASGYRIFMDEILVRGTKPWLPPLLVGLAGAGLLSGFLSLLQKHALARAETALATGSVIRYFWTLLSLPLSFFGQRYAGDLISRMTQTERMASQITTGLMPALIGIVPIVGYGSALFLVDPWVALVVLLVALVALGVLSVATRYLGDANARSLGDEAKLQGITLQGLAMRDDFRASGTEDMFMRRWNAAQRQVLEAEQHLVLRTNLINEAAAFLLAMAGVLVLVVGGARIMDGHLSIGLLLAAQALLSSFTSPMLGLVGVGARVQSIRGIADRLNDAMNYALHKAETSSVHAVGEVAEEDRGYPLALRGVGFGYGPGAPPVVDDFTLTVPLGARIALVGASGSGKSTLGRLMVGLVPPSSGEVRVFGRRLQDWSASHLRREIAYVDQNIGLFADTIRDNITLWDATMPEEQYVAAAHDAQIHTLITSRPGGYAARLQENGSNLSGGERQRLALARAFAVNPRIMVLDEATSALDPATEQAVMDAIRRRGCTCVIIAHRLSSIQDCDAIIVLEGGKVMEMGRHHELLARQGAYARLVEN